MSDQAVTSERKTGGLVTAMEAWGRILGEAHVLTGTELDAFLKNAGGLTRQVPAVLRPGSTEEVREAIRVANRYLAPVYPISRGKNWGYGSRLPVHDGTSILDLSRMERIREVNGDRFYAVVEPGVTQRQMFERLRQDRIAAVFNVTGAGLETSLIGNALERGAGYMGSRAGDFCGYEVVLGNGDLVRTGFGHFEGALATYQYPAGVGPSLDGLLAQSNFGVVTAAGMELLPVPECRATLVARLDRPEIFERFIDALGRLRRRRVIDTVVHIGNRARFEITLAPLAFRQLDSPAVRDKTALRERVEALVHSLAASSWSAVTGVMGTRPQVAEARRIIRRELRGIASVAVVDDARVALLRGMVSPFRWIPAIRDRLAVLDAMGPLFGLTQGVPTDAALPSVSWPLGDAIGTATDDPDQGHAGILYCAPTIPAEGRTARNLVEEAERIFGQDGFAPYITLNLVTTGALVCVINLSFDRRIASRVTDAQGCIARLYDRCIELGYIPYRAGIQSMGHIVRAEDPYWRTVARLKDALDPNHIIAPGRYCPNS